MSTAAILSIKPVYANQILGGTKTVELRKSSMGLGAGDVILVYSSAPEQRLSFWFRVRSIESLPVEEMWRRYHDRLGIAYDDYATYFNGVERAVGFHVGELHALVPICLQDLEELVPGFVPPQGIIWLRDDFGKYRKLLPKLSVAIPEDSFPQRNFELDFSTSASRANE